MPWLVFIVLLCLNIRGVINDEAYIYMTIPLTIKETREKLNPSYISGFCDAEGSFVISIRKNTKYKTG